MKKQLIIYALILFSNYIYSQISTTKVIKEPKETILPYDSLSNYLGGIYYDSKEIYKYLGQ